MRQFIGLRTLKTAIGATIAIFIAQQLKLDYALSAGIITILSVQNTKKKSIDLTIQRIGSTVLALTISCSIFLILGFNAFAFGLYLLLFIPLAVKFQFSDGIVVSSVLVTHILSAEIISATLLINEMLLMFIGAGVGIILNLYMPSLEVEIKQTQAEIENQFKIILLYLVKTIRSQSVYMDEETVFNDLSMMLEKGELKAYRNSENVRLEQMTYYVKYMEMRTHQLQVLNNMRAVLGKVCMTSQQSEMLATLTEKVALAFYEENNAEKLLSETENTLAIIREQALPETRFEFENRALLFQYLNELRYLLEIKRQFRYSLTEEQLNKFGCTNV